MEQKEGDVAIGMCTKVRSTCQRGSISRIEALNTILGHHLIVYHVRAQALVKHAPDKSTRVVDIVMRV